MATYVPGVQGYFPKFEPFTPDYKFLSAVLDTRTDRYNTNYKDLNDTYSKIVYSDLSRQDTQSARDQYANKLVPKLEQISGLDLSIQQNADAAKALFKPFYENDLIVRDMVNTQQYKQQKNYTNNLLNSNDKEVSSQYWQTGVELMDYQMQDFVNADPDKAINIGAPKYVPNADLFNLATTYLDKSGLKVEMDKLDPTGQWIIKEKNGDLIVPAAYNAVKNALLNDPKVINAYQASSYVAARQYADKGIKAGQFSSIDEGRKAWATAIMDDVKNKTIVEIDNTKKTIAGVQEAADNWENYKSTHGILPGSEQEKAMNNNIAYLTNAKEELKSKEDILQKYNQPAQTLDNLMNNAYNIRMSFNMNADLTAAAKQYGMRDASITLKENQFAMEQLKASDKFAIHSEKIGKSKSSSTEGKEETDNTDLIKALNPNSTGSAQTTTFNADKDGGPNPNTDVVGLNNTTIVMQTNKTANETVDWILTYHQLTESLKPNGQPSMMMVNGVNLSLEEARNKLSEPANAGLLKTLFEDAKKNVNDADKINPNLLEYNNGIAYNELKLGADEVESKMLKAVESVEKANNIYYSNMKNVKATKYGEAINKQEQAGLPMLVATPLERKLQELNPTNDEKIKAFSDWSLKNRGHADVPRSNADWDTGYMLVMDQKQKSLMRTEGDTKPLILSKDEFINDYKSKLNKGFIKNNDGSVKRIPGGFIEVPIQGQPMYASKYGDLNVVTTDQKMIDDATEAYNTQLAVLNGTLNGRYNFEVTKEGLQGIKSNVFQAFTVDQFFRGKTLDQMQTGDLTTFPIYAETVNPYNVTPDAKNMMMSFGQQYNNTNNIGIVAGDINNLEPGDLTKVDPEAKFIVDQMIQNVNEALLDPKTPKSATPLFTIKYAPVYGTPKDPTKSAAYIIDFDKEYVKTFLNKDKTNKGTVTDADVMKYSKITVSFPKENDVNPRAYGNYEYSAVENKVNNSQDHKETYTHPNGGSVTAYKNGDTWMYSVEYKRWDPNKKAYVTENTIPAKPMTYSENNQPVSTGDVDRVFNSLKLALNENAKNNLKDKEVQQKTTFFNQPPGYILDPATGKYIQQ